MSALATRPTSAGSLREGSYLVIDNEPFRVVQTEKSKTGKHGSAKVRIVAVSLFGGSKKSIVTPADSNVNVPMIEKKNGQIVSVSQDSVQVMDLENYSTFEIAKPPEPEIMEKLAPGAEVEFWIVMDYRRIMRVK